MELMTPSNPRWEEFCDRLAGEEGCNFHETIPGDTRSVVWTCKGGTDKSMASAILKDMGFDIEKSLDYFDDHGGHCDCEILLNVDNRGTRIRGRRRPGKGENQMTVNPMTKKQAKDFHGSEIWNRTNSVLCDHCRQPNFFHGNDFPPEFDCANCGEENKKDRRK